MSVSGGDDFAPRMNVAGRAAEVISGPEPERWVIDFGGSAANQATKDVQDMAAFDGVFGSYDDVAVVVYRVIVHIEGYKSADYIVAKLGRNGFQGVTRVQDEIQTGGRSGEFEFYTGASDFDSGAADAGNQGDGHQWAESWEVPASSPHKYLFHLTEDDSIEVDVSSDGSNDVSPKWRFFGAVVEFLD